MPMRQELCDLPLRQRGGKRAPTWRRWGGSTALSLHPFPSSPWSAAAVWGSRASLRGEAWRMPFPGWMERIALSCTALLEESCAALGDSLIDYFKPSMEVPCKHTYISAAHTHTHTHGGRSEACLGPPHCFIIRLGAARGHLHSTLSDGERNTDEWKDEGINKW